MKNKARKPVLKKSTYLKYGFVVMECEDCLCPRCRGVLNAGPNYQPRYCSRCGQKINFTGIEWAEEKQLGFAEGQEVL